MRLLFCRKAAPNPAAAGAAIISTWLSACEKALSWCNGRVVEQRPEAALEKAWWRWTSCWLEDGARCSASLMKFLALPYAYMVRGCLLLTHVLGAFFSSQSRIDGPPGGTRAWWTTQTFFETTLPTKNGGR